MPAQICMCYLPNSYAYLSICSYLHMQLMSKFTSFIRFKSLSQDHLIIIFGSSSISYCAHQIHILLPANPLLDSGICIRHTSCYILQGIRLNHLTLLQTSIATTLTSYTQYHAELSINLATWASLSIIVGATITAIPVYPYLSTDYPTVLCLFVHHT